MKLNDTVFFHIHALNCKAESMADAIMRADGLVTYAQYKVLVAILEGGRTTVSSVGTWLGISAPTASQLCHTLANKQLITITPNHHDMRQKDLAVTPAGKTLHAKLSSELEEATAQALASLPPETIARFICDSAAVEEALS